MELIAAILLAGPLGFYARSSRAGLALYLVVWAIIFPIQTVAISQEEGLEVSYWVINALILGMGIGLNRFGRRRRESRDARRAEPARALTG